MTAPQLYVLPAAALLGLGLWLMLPRGAARGRTLGAAIAAVTIVAATTLGVIFHQIPLIGDWTANTVFYVLAAITILSAVAAMTLRSPVYCALWFAMSLLGVAGLFLFLGAQFLGLATVVVYAGAIVVTFLFVLMLAQPEGHSFYDRLSWEAPLSAFCGALIVGVLAMTLDSGLAPAIAQVDNTGRELAAQKDAWQMASAEQRQQEILSQDHVARLGGRLFSEHLIAVEVAGVLLMVALIGATAIVSQGQDMKRSSRGGDAVDAALLDNPRGDRL